VERGDNPLYKEIRTEKGKHLDTGASSPVDQTGASLKVRAAVRVDEGGTRGEKQTSLIEGVVGISTPSHPVAKASPPGKKRRIGIEETTSRRAKEKELLHFNDGVAYMKRGEYLSAGKEFSNVLNYNPENVEALCNLSVVAMKTGRLNFAGGYLREALRISPHHVRSLLNMGALELRSKQYSLAAHTFEKVLMVSPGNVTALVNLSMSYRKLGKWDEALASITRAAERESSNPEVWYAMALAHLGGGDMDDAREPFVRFLTHAKEGDPRVPPVRSILKR
jgi:Tfp pilus assembly protein PilF